ncbi:ABC transporter ATP-binding protein [Kribbella sp. NPDC050820]|uniref:ABC transporter ATP-binding protein n=1 Tax=Kribbella sp. NPDC050820 TaxID=3155408 RepID=UPI0033DCFF78
MGMAVGERETQVPSTVGRTDERLGLGWVAWRTSRLLSAAVALTALFSTLTPFGIAATGGLLLDRLPDAISAGWPSAAAERIVGLLALVGVLILVQTVCSVGGQVAGEMLGDRIDMRLQRNLMARVMAPAGIAHLENPDTVDLISTGRDGFSQWLKPGRIPSDVGGLISGALCVTGGCVVVMTASVPMGLAALLTAAWTIYEGQRISTRAAERHYGSSVDSRRAEYCYDLATEPAAGKEVRIFDLAGYLLARFNASWTAAKGRATSISSVREGVSLSLFVAVMCGFIVWLVRRATAGEIDVALCLVYVQAGVIAAGGAAALDGLLPRVQLAMTTYQRYRAAMAAAPMAAAIARRGDGAVRPDGGIRFSNVSFRYPNSTRDVLRGVDLFLPAGKSVAIVGLNGAGKTTLLKLLCRLYEPTSGSIEADGTDIRTLDLEVWRRQLAAVFQDSVRWDVDAAANIAFGAVQHADDVAGLQRAAVLAGVQTTIERLPLGWGSMLSTQYADGADLSGGEWQKLALARAMFATSHGAKVLILDEPAAHLDARSEAALYDKYIELTEGLTTVVVSHRFSTVRRASLIVVIDDGKVVEEGSHDELMREQGRYARLFTLQAESFADARTDGAGA